MCGRSSLPGEASPAPQRGGTHDDLRPAIEGRGFLPHRLRAHARQLGELLLRAKLVTQQQLLEALDVHKASGVKLSKVFVNLGFVKHEDISERLSRHYRVPSIDLEHFEIEPAVIRIVPAETARKYQVLPLSVSGKTLTIAMADPANVFAMDDIKFMTEGPRGGDDQPPHEWVRKGEAGDHHDRRSAS